MPPEGSENGKRNAKRPRQEMTPPEIALWLALRRNEAGLRFRKQHAVNEYVLDFIARPHALLSRSMARPTIAVTGQRETPCVIHGSCPRGCVSCAIQRSTCCRN